MLAFFYTFVYILEALIAMFSFMIFSYTLNNYLFLSLLLHTFLCAILCTIIQEYEHLLERLLDQEQLG